MNILIPLEKALCKTHKSREKWIPCECKQCKNIYKTSRHRLNASLNPNVSRNYDFCSPECSHKAKITKVMVVCKNCNKPTKKRVSQAQKYKNNFCSSSCAGVYTNANREYKKTGYRRSKLELWLKSQLLNLYPDLKFHFNETDAIGSELDIYLPKLRLAFEISGIFHYKPIFGKEQLNKIQDNDKQKVASCKKGGIKLYCINTSEQKHVTPKNSQKYLDAITKKIDKKLKLGC